MTRGHDYACRLLSDLGGTSHAALPQRDMNCIASCSRNMTRGHDPACRLLSDIGFMAHAALPQRDKNSTARDKATNLLTTEEQPLAAIVCDCLACDLDLISREVASSPAAPAISVIRHKHGERLMLAAGCVSLALALPVVWAGLALTLTPPDCRHLLLQMILSCLKLSPRKPEKAVICGGCRYRILISSLPGCYSYQTTHQKRQ
ncbi:hypothetical protein J6590_066845 [Homalodisca vitripennis]|nr:hypothetical protein J6590_066845 [Homalodisca vitripennis]